MDFFPPQSFSDLLIVWALMFVVMLGFYFLGRLIWALGLGPQATAIADKMERIQQTVMRPTGQRLIGTADQLSKVQGWPFHNLNRR